jgi:hypothetical protein
VQFFSAYRQVVNRVSPPARAPSGKRTRVACWRWHSAIANFCNVAPKRIPARSKKSSLRQNAATSNAASVRSPEIACGRNLHSPA